MIYSDDEDFYYPSEDELDRADAAQRGYNSQSQAWILSDRDVWHKNPYYVGPPVRHPEDDYEDDFDKADQKDYAQMADLSEEDLPF